MSGNAPADWLKARLGDHATVKARLGWKGLKAEEYVHDGPIFLAAPNLRGGRIDFDNVDHIPQWRYDESPEIQLAPGDVLLVKDGSTLGMSGFIKSLPAPTTVNGSVAVIRPQSSLSVGFLYQIVNGSSFQRLVWLKRSGLGVPHLFQADLREFRVHLPPLFEQEKIGEGLSWIDEAIEHSDALTRKLQRIRTGMIADLFTRGLDPEGNVRPSPSKGPETYHFTRVGTIPTSWECVPVSECALKAPGAITIGPFGSNLVAADYRGEGVPVVFVRDVREEGFDWRSGVYLSPQKAAALAVHAVRSGDVIASKMGAPPCIACVYPPWMPDGIITADIIRLRADATRVHAGWLATAINHHRFRVGVRQITAGVTRPKITLSDFRRLLIALPPLDEQRAIAARVQTLTDRLTAELTSLLSLRTLKAGLMDDLLTGRVRVKLAEVATT